MAFELPGFQLMYILSISLNFSFGLEEKHGIQRVASKQQDWTERDRERERGREREREGEREREREGERERGREREREREREGERSPCHLVPLTRCAPT